MSTTSNLKSKTTSRFQNIQARIDEQTGLEAEAVLKKVGFSKSQVVLALFKQIALKKRIPFDISAFEYEDKELSQKEFLQQQAYLISQMDKNEEIPSFDASKVKPIILKKAQHLTA
jgi:addiction module RelB/DinJ family antitoxin